MAGVQLPPLHMVQAERSRRRLHTFLRHIAWPALWPTTPFCDNWHIGAICFPAGTAVETESGAQPIETITCGTMVQSCNHLTGKLEWRKVLAVSKSPGQPLLRMHTAAGMLRLTAEHPIYINGLGYQPAANIRVGDGAFFLQALWDRIQEKPSQEPRQLLRDEVLRFAKDLASTAMRGLHLCHQQIGSKASTPVHVVSQQEPEASAADGLCSMRERGSKKPIGYGFKQSAVWRVLRALLLWPVRDRSEEPGLLQRRQSRCIRSDVQEREAEDFGARRLGVFRLWGNLQTRRAPYRSQQEEQRHEESRGGMPTVPPETGERGCRQVVVERIDCEIRPDWVFNIEVEGNNNYFANGFLVHNCEHLEAVKLGQIKRLIINMPFRMLKSTIVSHAFPAWDWIDNPSRHFLTASYSTDIATRDAVDARRIIESNLYQICYGHRFKLTSDQNVKSRYENDKRGTRTVTSPDSAGTGFGGDIRIVDDPVSAKQADSLTKIRSSIEWWKGTMSTRANDPASGRAIVVHQRLNSSDLTGHLLAEETGWDHLVLPFRYDPKLSKTTSLGFVDPRRKEGELIHPSRINEETAQALEKPLGEYHRQAQLQQNPAPRGGIIFKGDEWKFWKVLPELQEVAISVDCTFKSLETSDHVAIQAWGNKGANKYLLRRQKERMGFSATVNAIRAMKALYPRAVAILIEDKANGSAVIETLKGEIGGIIAVNPDGGKAARGFAMTPECEAGNIWLPDPSVDPTIGVFLHTAAVFTGAEGGDDDEIDAMTQYVNWQRVRTGTMGIADFMRAQAEAAVTAKSKAA